MSNPLDFGTFQLSAEAVAVTFVMFVGAGLAAALVAVIAPGRR